MMILEKLLVGSYTFFTKKGNSLITMCVLPVLPNYHKQLRKIKKDTHIKEEFFLNDTKFYGSYITGPEVIKLFSCSTQLSTKFIMLMNVKMPTIVGILTFISMINTTSERL